MKRPRRRARLTIAAMMGLVALAAIWLAANRDRFRPRREVLIAVDMAGSSAVDGELLAPGALAAKVRALRADRVVIASTPSVSYAKMSDILAAIASAGVRDVHFTSRYGAVRPTDQQRAAQMLR